MRKPTLFQFVTLYALLWMLGLFLIYVYSDTSGRFGLPTMFVKMACWNMVAVIINVFGAIIMRMTGKVPWREQAP